MGYIRLKEAGVDRGESEVERERKKTMKRGKRH